MKQSHRCLVSLLLFVLTVTGLGSAQLAPKAPPSKDPPAANAWMRVPTPSTARNADGLSASFRTERDKFWDDAIGSPVPLVKNELGTGTSEADEGSDSPEIPHVPNRT